jgi:dUTP pyrophosphatase
MTTPMMLSMTPRLLEDADHIARARHCVKVKKLREGVRLPARGSEFAAGADLSCIEPFTLQPGERRLIPTGLAFEIPPGYYGRVAPRSGLAVRHGIDTLAGVIDADYRGECQVLLINLSDKPVSFEAGERIAQLIIERVAACDYVWADELNDTDRGTGGFGSTG